MWILPLVGYAGLLLGFGFLTLAIASGLYYLSELVEEHTVPAKKFLTRLIYTVIAVQALLLGVDRLPLGPSLLGMASHAIYLQNLRFFPIVRLSDPVFLVSCALVLLNHYLWFRHFANPTAPPPPAYDPYRTAVGPALLPSFTEVAAFFFLQVWLVPFALFVSLSAGENVLPSMGSEYATNPSSPLVTPTSAGGSGSNGGGGVMRSPSALGLPSMGAMLSPRSASTGSSGGQRSPSAVREGSLGLDSGRRRRRGAKGLVRVAVDGIREWVGVNGEALGLWQGERARRW